MVRAVGALLLIAGASAWGVAGAAELSRRARQLRAMASALRTMESEICSSLTPMEGVLHTVSCGANGSVRRFFENVTAGFSDIGGSTFAQVWQRAAENTPELPFSRAEKLTLIQLGRSLGRYDAQEQRAALEYAIMRFESFCARAEEDKREKFRLNAFMGVAAGVFAVVILL
ncbi:MAG: stage III sporulation protein AB [Oscillospiraceae bacterium]|nr:stage III sporulation protein AB [Oscillospiraceae bacterium]